MTPLEVSLIYEKFFALLIWLFDKLDAFIGEMLHSLMLVLGVEKEFTSGDHPIVEVIVFLFWHYAHHWLHVVAVVEPSEHFKSLQQFFKSIPPLFLTVEKLLVNHQILNNCSVLFFTLNFLEFSTWKLSHNSKSLTRSTCFFFVKFDGLLCNNDTTGCDCPSSVTNNHRSKTLNQVWVFLVLVLSQFIFLKFHISAFVHIHEILELFVAVYLWLEDVYREVVVFEGTEHPFLELINDSESVVLFYVDWYLLKADSVFNIFL